MAIAHARSDFYRLTQRNPHRKNILIEGDSWMSHPLVGNLTVQLNKYLRGRCNIFSIGEVGHLAKDMMSGYQLEFFQSVLRATQWRFDLIVMSAGGNDILENSQAKYALKNLLTNAGTSNYRDYIIQPLFDQVLDQVIAAYQVLIDTRNTFAPNCPIITHTYDYMFPRNLGFSALGIEKGPWVYPAMIANQINDQLVQREIIKLMLNDFKQRLDKLATINQNFHVVDTQGCLNDSTSWPINIKQWDDEIHPDSAGFNTLVWQRFGPQAKQLLA